MIKTLRKLEIEGNFLSVIKNICKKTVTDIILNGEKLETFSLRSGTRQVCLLSLPFCNTVLDILPNAIKKGMEIKCIQTGKE